MLGHGLQKVLSVRGATFALATGIVLTLAAPANAQKLLMKDGRVLSGRINMLAGIAATADKKVPQAGEVPTSPVLLVDDDLRRTYVPRSQIVPPILSVEPEQLIKIPVWQQVAHGGARMIGVGPAINITPFDKYGRRTYEMITGDGPLSVVQGISELTPRYAKVEGLFGQPRPIAWDMRMATSSIPAETLAAIMVNAIPQDDLQSRLQVVRFYTQGERFSDATRELSQVIRDFKDHPDSMALLNDLKPLRQAAATRMLKEIELRKNSGQHQLARVLLDRFPTDEVSGPTLQQVRELATSYENDEARIKKIAAEVRRIVREIGDPDDRGIAGPVAEEVATSLTHNNVGRMAPFVQLLDDPTLSAGQKGALAISGWILGSDDAKTDLTLAIELVKVRDAVVRYLRAQTVEDRDAIIAGVSSFDALKPEYLAKIIAHMAPPWHEAKYADAKQAGDFVLGAPGLTADGDFRYHVQLPPEYDPMRRYPLILALNGQYNDPTNELEFWAGDRTESADGSAPPRAGQAMRHGYITLAPQWLKPHQLEYEYSGREHVAVLTCLRDALRRFSVDTDRVFLTGHDIGGDAAWDMGQAHPDLWAGVVPIVASSGDTYVRHYWENAANLPYYFVCGELDGIRMSENSSVFDKYLRKRYDATVVEYLGRGHEPFHDEILKLLEWMGRRARGKPPQQFVCSTLRPWDNYFWWIECAGLPEEKMVFPSEWNLRKPRAVSIEGKQRADGALIAQVPSEAATIWLNPDVVDFSKPVKIDVNNRHAIRAGTTVAPSSTVLLEDVRTRGDRQRPYWAKIEWPETRAPVALTTEVTRGR